MNENLGKFVALAQWRITYFVLSGFFGLVFCLLVSSFLPFKIDEKILTILHDVVEVMIGIVVTCVNFWMMRGRPANGDPSPLVQPPETPAKQE